MTMRRVLVASPNFDLATREAHPYFAQFAEEVSKLGEYEVVTLYGPDANRENYWREFERGVTLFFGVGHGNYTTFTLYNKEIVSTVCDVPKVEGTVGLWLSCEMGRDLLPDMVRKGLWAGIGWKEVYVFTTNATDDFIGTLRDAMIKYCSGELWRISDAFEYIKQRYTEAAERWREENELVAEWLEWDRDNAVLEGDPDAWIAKPVEVLHQEIELDYEYDDERVNWEERRLRLHVAGRVFVRETGEPVAGREVKLRAPTGETVAATTGPDGSFRLSWEARLDTCEHLLEFSVSTDTFEVKNEITRRYLGAERRFEIRLPLLKVRTSISAWTEYVVRKELMLPLSVYKVKVGARVVAETGEVVVPSPDEVMAYISDHTGTWRARVEVEGETIYLILDEAQYPTVRLRTLRYPVHIEFRPKDPRLARASERLMIELRENASGPLAAALLLLLIILAAVAG